MCSYGALTREAIEACTSIFFDAMWLERQGAHSALRQDFDGPYQRLASVGSWAHLYMLPTLEVMFLQYGQIDAAQLVQILSSERTVQGALEFAEDHAANQLPAAPDRSCGGALLDPCVHEGVVACRD